MTSINLPCGLGPSRLATSPHPARRANRLLHRSHIGATLQEQRLAFGKRAFGDGVEDDVIAFRSAREIFLPVVDNQFGPERTHEVDIGSATGGGHPAAQCLGNLYGEVADTPRATKDEDLILSGLGPPDR